MQALRDTVIALTVAEDAEDAHVGRRSRPARRRSREQPWHRGAGQRERPGLAFGSLDSIPSRPYANKIDHRSHYM